MSTEVYIIFSQVWNQTYEQAKLKGGRKGGRKWEGEEEEGREKKELKWLFTINNIMCSYQNEDDL